MKIRLVVLPVMTLLFFGTVLTATDVKTDYNPLTDFTKYTTFSWLKAESPNPLLADRIQQAVSSQLAMLGWIPVSSNGQLAVAAVDIENQNQGLVPFYNAMRGDWQWRETFGKPAAFPAMYKTGTLIVDLFDSQTKKLLWRGIVSGALTSNPEKTIKNLNKFVQKMFEGFPPDVSR